MKSKFVFKLFALVVVLILALTACGGAVEEATESAATEAAATDAPATEAATAEPASTQPEGEVDIVAWASYIERGENDPTVDWVTAFEAETGCKVNVTVAATSDEMVSLMTAGGYDLVTASGDASLRLIYGETV